MYPHVTFLDYYQAIIIKLLKIIRNIYYLVIQFRNRMFKNILQSNNY